MKNIILIITLIFYFTNIANSQNKGVTMTSTAYGKTAFFKENKRVRIKTVDGELHRGRLKIIDNQTILIDGEAIALDSVLQIKRHSLAVTIISVTLIVAGTILFTTAMILAEPIGQAIVGTFTGLIVSGAAILPLIPNKHNSKRWTYNIEEDINSKNNDKQ